MDEVAVKNCNMTDAKISSENDSAFGVRLDYESASNQILVQVLDEAQAFY